MVLSIIGIALAVVAIAYAAHVAVVYQRFNDGIKDWANALDASTKDAIDRSARQLLRELDERVSTLKNDNDGTEEERTLREDVDECVPLPQEAE